jgi:lysophospholipase L1-like esterase
MHLPLYFAVTQALLFLPLQSFAIDEKAPSPSAFEKWEKEIAAIEERDRPAENAKNSVVFVGSSSIKRWTSLKADFPEHQVLNHGFGGSRLSDAVHFADRLVLAYEPSFIVVYSGGNDINAHCSAEQVFDSFCEFVSKVRTQMPSTPIAYISIAGNPKRWAQVADVIKANALIETYTKQNPGLLFIDVFHPMLGIDGLPRPEIFTEDKLHMNAAGYKLWKEIVGRYLPTNTLASKTR